MVKIGISVRVIHPEYASGMRGIIQAQEPSGRWIIQLDGNPFKDTDNPLILSIEESEFEVISRQE